MGNGCEEATNERKHKRLTTYKDILEVVSHQRKEYLSDEVLSGNY